jgi:hypothetical protein
VSNPPGHEHVVPTTLLRDSRESGAVRPRIGDLDGRGRNGELDGVNLRRLEGVDAIFAPLTHEHYLGLDVIGLRCCLSAGQLSSRFPG